MKAKLRKQTLRNKLGSPNIFKLYLFRKIPFYLVLLTTFFLFNSCSKVIENLKDSSKEIGENVMEGITDNLTADSTQQEINQLIGSITKTLRDSLSKEKLAKIGVDTLSEIIGKKLIEGIEKGLDGEKISSEIDTLFDKMSASGKKAMKELFKGLTDEENKKRLTQFFAETLKGSIDQKFEERLRGLTVGLLDSVITDRRLEQIKSSLLGQEMGDTLNARLDSALSLFINRINKDFDPIQPAKISFLQKWVKELLLIIGLIAAGLIAFFYYQKRKSLRVAQLLMTQINDMPNQNSYDELTQRISKIARTHNIEYMIREILKDNGMLGNEDWEVTNRKLGSPE